MKRLLHIMIIASALLSLPSAAEDRKKVLVVDAGGDEVDAFKLKTQVDAALRFGINKNERVRVLDATEPFQAKCDDTCIQGLAQKHAADLVVIPRVAANILNVTVFDAAGAVVVAGDRPYDPDATTEAGVGALVTQLMNPPAYAGTVHLAQVPPGASVFIDGVPLQTTRITEGIRLRVGPHQIVARDQDGNLTFAEVEVALEGKHDVPMLPTAASGFPTWPAWVATGSAAVLAVASAVFFVDVAVSTNRQPDTENRTVTDYGEEISDFNNAPRLLALQLERRDITRGLAARDQSILSGTVLITVAAAAATSAAILWSVAGE